jgi:hypothetical protein
MDLIALTALIIAIIAGLSRFVKDTHIKKCSLGCIESDCNTKNITPSTSKNNITETDL